MNFTNFKERLNEQLPNTGIPTNKEHCEVHKGTTPNGGVYSVSYFFDKNSKPCKKAEAKFVNVVEFSKDGNRINEAYTTIGSGKR